MTQGEAFEIELVAAAIAKEGFPRGRESARDYRLRLARAAIGALRLNGEQTPRKEG